MFRPTRHRQISLKSILASFKRIRKTEEVNEPLKEIPSSTGSGASVEPVDFEVLGMTSSMLNIKLPNASIINLRYSNANQSVIALNGKVTSLAVELGKLEGGLIFQRCFNTSGPMSILMANKLQNSNFTVVNVSKDTIWTVDRDSLVAWTGNYIDLTGERKLVKVVGSGKIVLSSPGQTLQMTLQDGETVSVNPSTVVAYTGETPVGPRSIVDFAVPGISWLTKVCGSWASFTSYVRDKFQIQKPQIKVHPWISSAFSQTAGFARRVVNRLVTGNPDYMIEFSGPRTVLISDGVHFKDKIMTKEQIEKLKKKLD
ncbi:hypothetical protein KL949_003908 [Ogataea haglerorum]|uniref:Altered inheritance of mitochondria protein 24, mitochondrial n=1 Tax=Ogataea haglerorum TaxID=1937702 RepID=A0ABQ7RBD7_9ASCO|nr:hypothetical protein KL914_004362 [Ogataea haglerorum]KAG7715491.1 hypothetical protein KL913_003826 [Ogataea haglerorum]KAG7716013.1 hypothetical protein KL949_003908 [Ogataea haglerorum]KAG7746500.1 hypothetical protein KL912_004431 [Ogataea haglerorum]KAG7762520.1 hypothetical protein KL946_004636 [Ogataea haglerorum]